MSFAPSGFPSAEALVDRRIGVGLEAAGVASAQDSELLELHAAHMANGKKATAITDKERRGRSHGREA